VDIFGQVLDQVSDRLVDGLRADQVVVVEDYHNLLREID
jgi:hypothetical protein